MRPAGDLTRPTVRACLLALSAVLFVAGCGVYTASTGRVDESLKHMSVRYLENNTAQPSIGVDLSESIIQAIQTDNTLKIVPESDADTILSGTVTRYHLKEVMTSDNLTVNEYQVQISVILDLVRRDTGEEIFKKKRFSGTGNYLLDDPDNSSNEETARGEAAAEIVKDILAEVVQGW
jgi:hypothetical protein